MTIDKNSDERQVYELGYHSVPTLEESVVAEYSGKLRQLLDSNGGEVISEELPRSIALAYPLSKSIDSKKYWYDKSYFGWIKFEIETGNITSIDMAMRADPSIMRYLLVKTVRENTLYNPKPYKKEVVEVEDNKEVKLGDSLEEMDKSIEELVIN